MTKYKSLLFVILTVLATEAFAYQPKSGNVSATLGPYFYRTNFEGSRTTDKAPILGGFGIVAIGDLDDHGSLEVSMIYMHQIYYREVDKLYMAHKIKRMHMTMGYRWWVNPYFSTSLGFFSSYAMGDYSIIHSDYTPGTAIDTSAEDVTEYGFDFSFESELYKTEKFVVVANGRYSLSVTPKSHERGDPYGIMIGLRYMVQGKQ